MLRDCLSVNLVAVSPQVEASHHSATFRFTSDLTLPIRQLSNKLPKHKGKKLLRPAAGPMGFSGKKQNRNCIKKLKVEYRNYATKKHHNIYEIKT